MSSEVFIQGVETDDELRQMFGENAIITRLGKFNLVHLDNPSEEELEKRISEFNPDDIFEDECPLCRMLKADGGNVVYQ